ncbi:zinc metalloprotease [Nocardioides aestuarii]|uniref:Zinc metalloprotease n=1 Tax=Nocardioides aestuarii TaxID=252231 RepID=A0ABW4TG33_9ACTN
MQPSVSSTASRAAAVLLATAALLLAGLQAPAGAAVTEGTPPCFDPAAHGLAPASGAARGGDGLDHRPITAADQQRIAARTARLLAQQRAGGRQQRIRVPVRVHVMAAKNGAGNVSKRAIERQVAVMNRHFAGAESDVAAQTKVRFVLKGVDRFRNTRWHHDEQTRKYRKATRIGGARTLNIWLVDFGYLGIATFPWDYRARPHVDGVRVQFTSLPGGSQTNYDEGKTATHEVGHWLGLLHTFQGSCSETNDEVSDTPAQLDATSGCPPDDTDTCPLRAGVDPIHNYMDYSYDSCMDQFTPGQKRRMRQMWRAYRG